MSLPEEVIEALAVGISSYRACSETGVVRVPSGLAREIAVAAAAHLSARGYVVEQGWQTMETAPKDGTGARIVASKDGCFVGAEIPGRGFCTFRRTDFDGRLKLLWDALAMIAASEAPPSADNGSEG